MKIGILAVQGAFAEHKSKLEKLGARTGFARRGEYGTGKPPSGAGNV